jgi:aspartokinase
VAGVSGRTDLIRLRVSRGWGALEVRRWLLESVAAYDLVFAGLRPGGTFQLYLSDLEMPDPHSLRVFLEAKLESSAVALEIEERLGAVSLVGFGIGSRPADLLHAAVLESCGVDVLDLFTSRESLCFVVPREQVARGVQELHRVLIEEPEWELAASADGADR